MTTNPNDAHHKKQMMTKAIGIVGTVVVLALIITAVRSFFSGGPETSNQSSAGNSDVTLNLEAIPNQVAASIESERQAIAKAALSVAHDEAAAVLATLDNLSATSAAWQNEILPLLSNERGKTLAANADYVRSFDTINRQTRPTSAEIGSARVRVSALLEQVGEALAGNAALYRPSQERSQLLAAERQNAERSLQSFTEARQTIDALLVQAEQLGQTAPRTLQQAIDNMNRDYAAQKAAAISEQRQRAEREHLEQLAKLEYEKQTAIHEAERVKRAAELERERTRLETQARLTKEQEESERLRQLAESPAIQERFAPFLADGKSRVGGGSGMFLDERGSPAPLSYRMLKHLGAFDDYEKFSLVASHRANDRGAWPKPNTKDEWAKCEEDWQLFRDLAPLWLEMGKLNP